MPSHIPDDAPILSVNELNQYAKGILDMHVGKVWVTGEISNFSRPASGHWYFTLKDQAAQVRCAMFRNKNQFLRLQPDNGKQVLLQGSVSLYPQRGDYQLIVDYMEESGIGALQRQFELLKKKLQQEGLFEQHRKRTLPTYPEHIAIITSKSGAALQDMLRVLNNRQMQLSITLIPVSVQGDKAAPEICKAIALANQWNQTGNKPIDAMIVGRGGGSIEDLWPFNEETVARTISASGIPIISAVGHETDTTIADLVADVRAPTPSVAAEIISPELDQINQQLDNIEKQLKDKIQLQLHAHHKQLEHIKRKLQHPGQKLLAYRQQFDLLSLKLQQSQQQFLTNKQSALQRLTQSITSFNPKQRLTEERTKITQLNQNLVKYTSQLLNEKKQQFRHNSELLDSVSPLATLSRGYAIIENAEHRIIRNINDINKGEVITAKIKNGDFKAKVL